LRVEFLLKTDSGYPRDAEVTLFTLANPEHFLRFHTHWSAPPVSSFDLVISVNLNVNSNHHFVFRHPGKKKLGVSDISFKKTFWLMNIRPQDFLSHEPTLWFKRH